MKFHPQPNTRKSLPSIHDYPILLRRLGHYRNVIEDLERGTEEYRVCEAIIKDTADLLRAMQKNENEHVAKRRSPNFLLRFAVLPWITKEDWKKFRGYFRLHQYMP